MQMTKSGASTVYVNPEFVVCGTVTISQVLIGMDISEKLSQQAYSLMRIRVLEFRIYEILTFSSRI